MNDLWIDLWSRIELISSILCLPKPNPTPFLQLLKKLSLFGLRSTPINKGNESGAQPNLSFLFIAG